MKRIFLFLLFSPAFISNAQTTATNQQPVRLLLGGALEFGGDNLAEVYFTDGSVQKMNSGQGGTVFTGAQLRLTKSEKFSCVVVWVLNILLPRPIMQTSALHVFRCNCRSIICP